VSDTPATTPDWLRSRAGATPDRLALIAGEERLTFRELDGAVDATCAVLSRHVPKSGERPMIALLAGNSGSYVRAVHAIARLGAVLLPLNVRLAPAELVLQVQDGGASVVIADSQRMEAAKGLALPVVSLEEITKPPVTPVGFDGVKRFVVAEPMAVLYTSGTTGRPKGAVLTFGNFMASARASAMNLGIRDNDRWLAALPLFHVGGLSILLRSVLDGTTAVVHESFDPTQANAAIDNDGVTIMSVVANMLQRMLDERGERPYPPHLRCMLLGGGPAPQPLLEACAARGVPVVQTYGLTETCSQLTTLAPDDALRKLGSAGKALHGSEVRIVDGDRVCAPKEPGEIVARGPTVTPGYLNRPEASSEALRGGWLHTGDLGYVDHEGYLYVLDRRDDLIVSGGENVYPAEIESVLQSHPAVLEAGVIGVADERWGQVAHVVVVLRPGSAASADELIEWCRAHLAGYKTPRAVTFVTSLPRNAAGKLVRSELRGIVIPQNGMPSV
jgi:O-succinylbenzoic acid--CoA ligase